jgi:hypothetical protein
MSRRWDKGFLEVKQRQVLDGMQLTPAQRLAWLYQMLLFFQKLAKKPKD